jgi:hypothetical protein
MDLATVLYSLKAIILNTFGHSLDFGDNGDYDFVLEFHYQALMVLS